ncbi:AlpA family phage regulatory protein [Agrobacterium vitis]|uniref:AlpA family phage regulatory protein n=1 Tax=Agrobacterium vitis TaxID=373 RepID=A0A7K1RGZ2_AGRVI|nr:AlpA family phage regulatory protein [Agrobacterium vitis]
MRTTTNSSSKRLLRIDSVTARTGLTKRSVYHEISQGGFPCPVRISPQASAWIEAEVEAWIDSRIQPRGPRPHQCRSRQTRVRAFECCCAEK